MKMFFIDAFDRFCDGAIVHILRDLQQLLRLARCANVCKRISLSLMCYSIISTFLCFPPPRLSRFFPQLVDAKLVDSKLTPMASDLEEFLQEEELYGDRIEAEALANYKQLGLEEGPSFELFVLYIRFFTFRKT